MRKITEIYEEHQVTPHLALHQLQVAAVASLICRNSTFSVDVDSIVCAALLHDMGNVIKFDLKQTKEVFGFSDEEIEKIAKIKKEFIGKYGEDEHVVNAQIALGISGSDKIVRLIKSNSFGLLCTTKEGDDNDLKVLKYADMRVGPKGVVSYEDRMEEAGKRYANHDKIQGYQESERQKLVGCGKDIEEWIFSRCSIKREDITEESVAPIVELLKNWEM